MERFEGQWLKPDARNEIVDFILLKDFKIVKSIKNDGAFVLKEDSHFEN